MKKNYLQKIHPVNAKSTMNNRLIGKCLATWPTTEAPTTGRDTSTVHAKTMGWDRTRFPRRTHSRARATATARGRSVQVLAQGPWWRPCPRLPTSVGAQQTGSGFDETRGRIVAPTTCLPRPWRLAGRATRRVARTWQQNNLYQQQQKMNK
jgi:hypothetical protein